MCWGLFLDLDVTLPTATWTALTLSESIEARRDTAKARRNFGLRVTLS